MEANNVDAFLYSQLQKHREEITTLVKDKPTKYYTDLDVKVRIAQDTRFRSITANANYINDDVVVIAPGNPNYLAPGAVQYTVPNNKLEIIDCKLRQSTRPPCSAVLLISDADTYDDTDELDKLQNNIIPLSLDYKIASLAVVTKPPQDLLDTLSNGVKKSVDFSTDFLTILTDINFDAWSTELSYVISEKVDMANCPWPYLTNTLNRYETFYQHQKVEVYDQRQATYRPAAKIPAFFLYCRKIPALYAHICQLLLPTVQADTLKQFLRRKSAIPVHLYQAHKMSSKKLDDENPMPIILGLSDFVYYHTSAPAMLHEKRDFEIAISFMETLLDQNHSIDGKHIKPLSDKSTHRVMLRVMTTSICKQLISHLINPDVSSKLLYYNVQKVDDSVYSKIVDHIVEYIEWETSKVQTGTVSTKSITWHQLITALTIAGGCVQHVLRKDGEKELLFAKCAIVNLLDIFRLGPIGLEAKFDYDDNTYYYEDGLGDNNIYCKTRNLVNTIRMLMLGLVYVGILDTLVPCDESVEHCFRHNNDLCSLMSSLFGYHNTIIDVAANSFKPDIIRCTSTATFLEMYSAKRHGELVSLLLYSIYSARFVRKHARNYHDVWHTFVTHVAKLPVDALETLQGKHIAYEDHQRAVIQDTVHQSQSQPAANVDFVDIFAEMSKLDADMDQYLGSYSTIVDSPKIYPSFMFSHWLQRVQQMAAYAWDFDAYIGNGADRKKRVSRFVDLATLLFSLPHTDLYYFYLERLFLEHNNNCAKIFNDLDPANIANSTISIQLHPELEKKHATPTYDLYNTDVFKFSTLQLFEQFFSVRNDNVIPSKYYPFFDAIWNKLNPKITDNHGVLEIFPYTRPIEFYREFYNTCINANHYSLQNTAFLVDDANLSDKLASSWRYFLPAKMNLNALMLVLSNTLLSLNINSRNPLYVPNNHPTYALYKINDAELFVQDIDEDEISDIVEYVNYDNVNSPKVVTIDINNLLSVSKWHQSDEYNAAVRLCFNALSCFITCDIKQENAFIEFMENLSRLNKKLEVYHNKDFIDMTYEITQFIMKIARKCGYSKSIYKLSVLETLFDKQQLMANMYAHPNTDEPIEDTAYYFYTLSILLSAVMWCAIQTLLLENSSLFWLQPCGVHKAWLLGEFGAGALFGTPRSIRIAINDNNDKYVNDTISDLKKSIHAFDNETLNTLAEIASPIIGLFYASMGCTDSNVDILPVSLTYNKFKQSAHNLEQKCEIKETKMPTYDEIYGLVAKYKPFKKLRKKSPWEQRQTHAQVNPSDSQANLREIETLRKQVQDLEQVVQAQAQAQPQAQAQAQPTADLSKMTTDQLLTLASRLTREKTDLTQQKTNLEQQLATQKTNLEQQLATLQQEKANLTQQLATQKTNLEQQLATQKTNLEQQLATLRQQKTDWEREKADLTQQKTDLEREKADLQLEKTNLEQQLATQKTNLEQQLATLQQEKANLEQRIQTLTTENTRLRNTAAAPANQSNDVIRQLNNDLNTANKQITALNADVAARNDNIVQLRAQVQTVTNDFNRVTNDLDQMRQNTTRELADKDQELTNLKNRIRILEKKPATQQKPIKSKADTANGAAAAAAAANDEGTNGAAAAAAAANDEGTNGAAAAKDIMIPLTLSVLSNKEMKEKIRKHATNMFQDIKTTKDFIDGITTTDIPGDMSNTTFANTYAGKYKHGQEDKLHEYEFMQIDALLEMKKSGIFPKWFNTIFVTNRLSDIGNDLSICGIFLPSGILRDNNMLTDNPDPEYNVDNTRSTLIPDINIVLLHSRNIIDHTVFSNIIHTFTALNYVCEMLFTLPPTLQKYTGKNKKITTVLKSIKNIISTRNASEADIKISYAAYALSQHILRPNDAEFDGEVHKNFPLIFGINDSYTLKEDKLYLKLHGDNYTMSDMERFFTEVTNNPFDYDPDLMDNSVLKRQPHEMPTCICVTESPYSRLFFDLQYELGDTIFDNGDAKFKCESANIVYIGLRLDDNLYLQFIESTCKDENIVFKTFAHLIGRNPKKMNKKGEERYEMMMTIGAIAKRINNSFNIVIYKHIEYYKSILEHLLIAINRGPENVKQKAKDFFSKYSNKVKGLKLMRDYGNLVVRSNKVPNQISKNKLHFSMLSMVTEFRGPIDNEFLDPAKLVDLLLRT